MNITIRLKVFVTFVLFPCIFINAQRYGYEGYCFYRNYTPDCDLYFSGGTGGAIPGVLLIKPSIVYRIDSLLSQYNIVYDMVRVETRLKRLDNGTITIEEITVLLWEKEHQGKYIRKRVKDDYLEEQLCEIMRKTTYKHLVAEDDLVAKAFSFSMGFYRKEEKEPPSQ